MPFEFILKNSRPYNMTMGDLSDFLEKYIKSQYPEHGITSWVKDETNDNTLLNVFKPTKEDRFVGGKNIPIWTNKLAYHYVNSYDKDGSYIICISSSNATSHRIAVIKTDCSASQDWHIKKEITDVIHNLFRFRHLPSIMDFVAKLPCADMKEAQLIHDSTSMDVVIDDVTIATYDFSAQGNAGYCKLKAHKDDWTKLLTNMGTNISIMHKDDCETNDVRL